MLKKAADRGVRVRILADDKDRLYWKASEKILRREPARSFWQRFQSGFFGMFDLDDQM
ncbi:Cardiolipin synthase (EC phosphatidylethanolamine-utilizing, bacterial type ClsC [Olavius algarvensis Delta 1 endosymbiont]|nr:Cardiolipin synthase (EC phosphatidylethanolamine-utilizing, bacterial type ClsC [Olavius algarvensis Delta 1 endosymbiont]